MTVYGIDLVEEAETHQGEQYIQENPCRYLNACICDNGELGCDCSGLVCKSCAAKGIYIPTLSWTQMLWCAENGGLIIPWEVAIWYAGALLFMYDDAREHIGYSRGDGLTTIEATPPAVQILPNNYQQWSRKTAALIPGVDYTLLGQRPSGPVVITPPKPPPPPPYDPNTGDDDMPGPKLVEWDLPDGTKAHDTLFVKDGSVWTSYVASAETIGVYPIAGPAAHADPTRTQERVDATSGIWITVIKGQLRFEVMSEAGPTEHTRSGIIECFYNPGDDAGQDGSRWRSRELPIT